MTLQFDPEFLAAATPLLEMRATMQPPAVHDALARRNNIETLFGGLLAAFPDAPDVVTKELKIKSFDGAEILVYHHSKADITGTTSAIVYVHGGGMIGGTAKLFEKSPKMSASVTGAQYFAVEYRLAPEVRDPVLVEDCYAALKWVSENAASLNVDPARIGVEGASAGGGLAAGVALMARDRKLSPPLAKQILVYPMLDYRNVKEDPVLKPFLIWNVEDNITGWTALLGDNIHSGKVSKYASPALETDLSGLPPTYIDVGTLDLFRDEDMLYAARIAATNTPVEFHLYPNVPHGFEALAPQIDVTQKALANRLKAVSSF